MRIKVLHVHRPEPGASRSKVDFECCAGRGRGTWVEGNVEPVAGEPYDVEFDFDEAVERSASAVSLPFGIPRISCDGDVNMVFGYVDSLDDDGMVYLRLAASSLSMIMLPSLRPRLGDYLLLSVTSDQLTVTAFGS